MKRKALAIVLTLIMLVGVLPMGAFAAETDTQAPAEAEAQTPSYVDTVGHWAEKSIERWTKAKVLEGKGNDIFDPDGLLTRAESMTIFSRLLKLTEKADISKLTDVNKDDWFYPYVETGYIYEITNGVSDTEFNPLGNITREQFFTMFARAVGIPTADKCDKEFTDLDQTSSWAQGSVYAMINRGFLNGYPDGSLQPQGDITRAEVAKVLDNAIECYITENGTYDLTGVTGLVVVVADNVKLTGTFDGHIVSSCPDSTLDLKGLKGKPTIHVLQDNTKIINAPAGTRVSIGPAADNVTVNGKPVKYSENPVANPYIVPAPTYGGGGGGGGYYQPTYDVTLKIDVPFANNAIILKANRVANTSEALTMLAADTAQLQSVVSEALDQLNTTKTTKNVDGYKIENVAGTITMTVVDPAAPAPDLANNMKALGDTFEGYMEKAAATAGYAEGSEAYNAWMDIAAAFRPDSFFTSYTASSMKVLDAGDYTQKVVTVLSALNTLQGTADSSDFVADLNTILGLGNEKYGLDWDGLGFSYKDAATAIQTGQLTVGQSAYAEFAVSDRASVNNDAKQVLGLDITGYADIQALVGAGLKADGQKTTRNVHGDYTLTVTVAQSAAQ